MPQEINLQKIFKPRRLGSAEILKVLEKKEILIYVAGPISFAEDLQDYRIALKEGLEKISPRFKIHDPWMREKAKSPTIKSEVGIAGIEEQKETAEGVITADLEDIANCDLIIAYMFRIGVGTSMEIFWASRILKKPVLVIYTPTDEGTDAVPLWLYGHANLIFQSKRGLYSFLRRECEAIEDEKNGQS